MWVQQDFKMQLTIKKRYPAFHGTDYEVANTILKEGFKVGANKHHWLGNGVYFFKEYDIASWWTSANAKEFGTDIKVPAIINVVLTAERDRILDLREIDDLKKFLAWKYEYDIGIPDNSTIEMEVYRCNLFDGILREHDIDIIIGSFNPKSKTYIKDIPELQSTLEKLKLIFSEVQYCVNESRQKDIIKIMGIEKISLKKVNKNGKN